MERNKENQVHAGVQEPLLFKTHRTPNTVRLTNRTRYEAPYPEEIPFLVHLDRIQNEKWITPMHYHNYFEITYIAEGSAWFLLNEKPFYALQGEMFMTKPMEVHCGGATVGCPLVTYTIGFTFDQLHELELPYYQIGGRRVIEDADGSYRRGHEQLIAELGSSKKYILSFVKAHFVEMLVCALRNFERADDLKTKEDPKIMSDAVKEAIQLIHAKGMNRLNSKEIAAGVNRSRSHLDREFKNFMGVTLGEYIRQIRLDMAKYLLKKNSDTISTISEQLQFESPQAFCMFFKRQTGLYPQEYRYRKGLAAANPS